MDEISENGDLNCTRGGEFGKSTTKASLISILVAAVFIKSPCVMLNVSLGVRDPQSNSI